MDAAATVVLNPDLLCYYFDKIEGRSQIKLAELLQKLSLPGIFCKEFKEVYSIPPDTALAWTCESKEVPFTCDEFQKALLFVDEKELAEEVKYILSVQAVQVMHHPLLKSNERSSLIPQHSEGKILFHVVLDMSVWNIKVVDEFQLSLLSPEIDEEGVFCNFQRCYQQGTLCIYCYQLALPISSLWNGNYFRYKYAVKSKGLVREEDLSMYKSNWRLLQATGVHQFSMHFDTEIRPFKTRSWFFLSKNQTSSSITKTVDTAMSVYMDWATIFKRWASIDTAADIEKETKQKAVWLTQIINNLKFQRYLRTVDATKPSELFVPHVHMEVLSKICSFLRTSPPLQRFSSSLIIIVALTSAGILAERIIDCDVIPIPPSNDIDFAEALEIFSQLTPEFKKFVFLPYVMKLSRKIPFFKFLSLLPLIHIVTLNDFVPNQPYELPSDEDEVMKVLFYELRSKSSNQQCEDIRSFDEDFDLRQQLQPYFKIDWLMPRVYLTLCSFSEIMNFVGENPEMVAFACWQIGIHAQSIEVLNDMIQEINELLRKHKLIQEEYKICLSGIVKIISKLTSYSLLMDTIQSFLHVADAHLTYDLEYATKCFNELGCLISSQLKKDNVDAEFEIEEWNKIFLINTFESTKELWTESITSKFCVRLKEIDLPCKFDTLMNKKLDLKDEIFLTLLNSTLQSLDETGDEHCETMWDIIMDNTDILECIHDAHNLCGQLAKDAENSLSNFCIKKMNDTSSYWVNMEPGTVLHSIEESVLMMTSVAGSPKKLKLIDLRKLSSKLMLVSNENKDVARFIEILSSIEKIAMLVIKLQEAGLVHYTHFRLDCRCNENEKMKVVIDLMEEALLQWRKSLFAMYQQYSCLDLYSSQQILVLKKELASIKYKPNSSISQELKKVLLLVNPNPYDAVIHNALNTASKKTQSMSLRKIEDECTNIIEKIGTQSDNFNVQMNLPKGEYLSFGELGEVLNALADAVGGKEDSLDAEKTIG